MMFSFCQYFIGFKKNILLLGMCVIFSFQLSAGEKIVWRDPKDYKSGDWTLHAMYGSPIRGGVFKLTRIIEAIANANDTEIKYSTYLIDSRSIVMFGEQRTKGSVLAAEFYNLHNMNTNIFHGTYKIYPDIILDRECTVIEYRIDSTIVKFSKDIFIHGVILIQEDGEIPLEILLGFGRCL